MEPKDTPFNKPRIVGGLVLLGVVSALFLIGRPVDSIQLGLLLGTALVLLGVDAGRKLLK